MIRSRACREPDVHAPRLPQHRRSLDETGSVVQQTEAHQQQGQHQQRGAGTKSSSPALGPFAPGYLHRCTTSVYPSWCQRQNVEIIVILRVNKERVPSVSMFLTYATAKMNVK